MSGMRALLYNLRAKVSMFYASILLPRGEYGVFSETCIPPNAKISLSNYSYFFLDVHVQEAYPAL
jgi:hypothetical protein